LSYLTRRSGGAVETSQRHNVRFPSPRPPVYKAASPETTTTDG